MDLYQILQELKIEYTEIEHEPVFTVEQAQSVKNRIEGTGCKNLFLTDKKGHYFLVILEESKKADMKQIAKAVESSHLSFAKESELEEILKLERGSVTPFGIIYDTNQKVLLVIDRGLEDKRLLVHPCVNTKTLAIDYQDLLRLIRYCRHEYRIIE